MFLPLDWRAKKRSAKPRHLDSELSTVPAKCWAQNTLPQKNTRSFWRDWTRSVQALRFPHKRTLAKLLDYSQSDRPNTESPMRIASGVFAKNLQRSTRDQPLASP